MIQQLLYSNQNKNNCQAGKHPINLQGDSKNYGRGGGDDFFGQDPNFFILARFGPFGPFFVMDDLDSSNSAWEWHQFSLGSARRQTKNSGSLQFFTDF